MTFNEYQELSIQTSKRSYGMPAIAYFSLGLAGEAGEVAEKIKKLFRDDAGGLTAERREAIVKELGDVLWYLSAVAYELNTNLEDVAIKNREKLVDRMARGVRQGDGDNR